MRAVLRTCKACGQYITSGGMIWVKEGERLPRFYGISHYSPERSFCEQGTCRMVWGRKAYPIPLNLIVSTYIRLWHFVVWKYGWSDQRAIRTKWFTVWKKCPKCKCDLEMYPFEKMSDSMRVTASSVSIS